MLLHALASIIDSFPKETRRYCRRLLATHCAGIILLASCFALLPTGCKKEPPVVPEPTLSLTAVDASCTEAWLKASITQLSVSVRLLRDGTRVSDLRLLNSDSLLIDEGLQPKHTYAYQLQRLDDNANIVEITAGVQVTTMDTTSHNFTWQIDTLGDGNSSVLYDVAIINDTLAYAVGAIYKKDSLGNWDPLPYNLVKWDGQQWELKRVSVMFRGSPVTVPLEGIFTLSATDIWLAGSIPIHGDGTNWVGYDIQTLVSSGATVSKMWGTLNGIYFVGRAGNIIRYATGTWQRVESGTTLKFQDIWGSLDARSGEYRILAVASDPYHSFDKRIVELRGETATAVSDSGIPQPLSGIWFVSSRQYYTVGSGIFRKHELTGGRWIGAPNELTPYYSNGVRGTGMNDVMVVGAFHDILHFNGWAWRSYPELLSAQGSWYRLSMQGRRVVAVGITGNRAVVLSGMRQ